MKLGSYKDVFKFEEGAVILYYTKTLMTRIWGQPNEVRIEGIKEWLEKASLYYEILTPNFEFISGREGRARYTATGGGSYSITNNTIYLYKKFSLTTLLHEFRHHMQHEAYQVHNDRLINKSTGELDFEGNTKLALEQDARAWSCSLYYNASPRRYNTAVKKGILHFF